MKPSDFGAFVSETCFARFILLIGLEFMITAKRSKDGSLETMFKYRSPKCTDDFIFSLIYS